MYVCVKYVKWWRTVPRSHLAGHNDAYTCFFLFIINISYRNWNSSYNLKSLSFFSCFVDFFSFFFGGGLNYFLVLGMIDILYYCDIRNICFVCDFIILIIIRPMVTQKSNSVTRRNLGVLIFEPKCDNLPRRMIPNWLKNVYP